MIKVAIVTSTGGAVMNAALKIPYIHKRIRSVISDRDCPALNIAREYEIDTIRLLTKDSLLFSNKLCDFFSEQPHDLVISFYTKLFKGKLLNKLYGKFVNFHPSILPACPGMDGFGDTIKSGSRFIGATVHLIDKDTDTGFSVIQSASPYNPNLSILENRNTVFLAQCKMMIQIVNWYDDRRVRVDDSGHPFVLGAQYLVSEFSPNLDFQPAIGYSP